MTRSMNYQKFIYWLRTSHGWIGLWGAVLGLLFGFSGIWLNHRSVLKLPTAQVRSNAQVALPDPVPASAEEMEHIGTVFERAADECLAAKNIGTERTR